MSWTRNWPTQTGYYWRRQDAKPDSQRVELVEVKILEGMADCGDQHVVVYVARMGTDVDGELKDPAWWLGPLAIPKPPPIPGEA